VVDAISRYAEAGFDHFFLVDNTVLSSAYQANAWQGHGKRATT
jgi:hypothetical protein